MVSSEVILVRGSKGGDRSFDVSACSDTRRKSFGKALQTFLSTANKKNQRKLSAMSPASSTSGDSVIMGAGFGDTTNGIMRKPSSGNTDKNNNKRKKSKRFSKVKSLFRRGKKSSSSSKLSSDKNDITEYGLEPAASGETEATSRSAASLGFVSPNNDITIMTDNGGHGSVSILHATFSEDAEDDSPLSISLPLLNDPFNEAFETSLIAMDAPEHGFNNADDSVDIRELSSITVVSNVNEGIQENEEAEADYSPAPLLLDISVDDASAIDDDFVFDGDVLETLVNEVEEVVEDAIKEVELAEDIPEDTETTPLTAEEETTNLEVETLVKVVEDVVEDAIAGIELDESTPITGTSMIFEAEETDISLEVVAPASCRSQLLDVVGFTVDESPEEQEVAVYSGVYEALNGDSVLEFSEKEVGTQEEEEEGKVTTEEGEVMTLETPSVTDEVNMSLVVEAPISCRSELLTFDSVSEPESEEIAAPSMSVSSTETPELTEKLASALANPPASPKVGTPRLDEILKGGDYEVEFTAAIILDETPVKNEVAIVPKRRKARAIMVKKIKQKGGKGLVAIVVTVVCFAVYLGNVSWKAAPASKKDAKNSTSSRASIFPPKEATNKPASLLTEDVDVPSTPPKVRKLLSSNYGLIEFPQSMKDTTQSQLEKMRPPKVDKDNALFWFV